MTGGEEPVTDTICEQDTDRTDPTLLSRITSAVLGDDDPGGLDEHEVGLVVVALHDELGLSFGDIAMCFPRDRHWVRETYQEHPLAGQYTDS